MPPRADPTMAQLLTLLMEDREASRAERTNTLETMQQLTQLMTNSQGNNGAGGNQGNGGNGHDDPRHKLKNFQNTCPPTFSKSEEPLDADDWLRQVENNLAMAGVEEPEKVMFSTHYLSGAARSWWDNTRAMQGGQNITWDEFKTKV